MKSCFIYLTLSVLLLVCCFEKKCAGSMAQSARSMEVAKQRLFIGRLSDSNESVLSPEFQMNLVITNNFVKGSYRLSGSSREIDLIGSVNRGNELILVQKAEGKTLGTFKGILENGANRLLRLSGVWTDVNGNDKRGFLVSEVNHSM